MADQPDKLPSATKKNRSFIDEQEKARINLERIQQYEQQLLKDSRFMEYAAAYSKHSVESFIHDFAQKKVRWAEWGAKYAAWKEKDDLEWQERTMEMLKEIQQKKLFDLQCRWRANQVKLPGIEICYDFMHWEKNILSCPVLDPVSDHEADLYLSYLNSGNYQLITQMGGWQHYDEIKKAHTDEHSYSFFPEWYSFYDSRNGTSAYLLLPDIRGEKERFYIALAEKEKEKEKENDAGGPAPAAATMQPTVMKPSLDYHKKGFMEWFIKTYDTPETYKFFKAMDDTIKHNKEDVNEMVSLLSEAENIIPVRQNKNYKQAIAGAAAELWRQKCLEIFPAVYQQYKIYSENNLSGNRGMDMGNFIFALSGLHRQVEVNKILRGRVLNGEPANLDF